MTQAAIDQYIIRSFTHSTGLPVCKRAQEVGISTYKYQQRQSVLEDDYKQNIERLKTASISGNYIADLENKVIEQHFDLDKGTGMLKGEFTTEPMSPKEVEVYFKIAELSGWRLSSYWNKAQSNGLFLVSANITQNKSTDDAVIAEDLQEAIRTVFGELAFTPVALKKTQAKSNNKSLMVYTSDKHIGAMLPANSLYSNEYSAPVFESRMQSLLQEILYLHELYGTFEHVYLLDLGDALDGWNAQTTRGGHHLPQNMDNRTAFETYLRTHKNFFDTLLQSGIAHNFHFKAVTNDNHSSDIAYMTNRSLEEYLNARYPQVTTQIFEKFIEHFEVDNHTFVICHGKDDIDMKHGYPLHLNDKTINKINNYLDYHKINSEFQTVHFIKGDLHQDTTEESTRFRYRNTSSMFGSSKWAMHNFLPHAPGVSFDVIENNTDRIYPYKMTFDSTASKTGF